MTNKDITVTLTFTTTEPLSMVEVTVGDEIVPGVGDLDTLRQAACRLSCYILDFADAAHEDANEVPLIR